MAVKQVTVFIGNKDFGLLRLIVSDPQKALDSLKAEGLSARLSDVIAVQISNEPGSLHDLLTALKDFNIEYMYVLSVVDTASMIVKIKDYETAQKVIESSGFKVLTQDEVCR